MKKFHLVLVNVFFFCYSCTTTATVADKKSDSRTRENNVSTMRVAEQGVSMRVLWTVTLYKLGANSSWGKKEAEKLLFKPLDIDANSITFDGKRCGDISFAKHTKDTRAFLRNVYHTTPEALGINDKAIEVVKTNCDLPGFGEYVRLTDSRLVVEIKGVFFFFEPAIQY